ncbi:tRNA (cytidine(34)-2'-O)-methyltransferase [Jannaschia seohaensis]|uniref:tRNA (cytidine(34)-2'-O)-methyltransferase n=1 Tax=Jannaschia seohaensis TaxID=475081 RepID=A0A2Y9ASQ8_9RHOB|nr:TrmH family RNA methyltransferase [Jannaschia seohaensis]PWJ17398.1 tRNA (cytidine/uridine-2'-O-)-methyltransferase [Jannaschia seohaensis]SSA47461.1 tRNA (cytidine/uridine-2'-O-)-methyltransferase [Jannaschia seohaensis]
MTPGPALVLYQPEIPGNTGTIGRTCVALDLDLCLIRPYGFELSDKTVRRAGLDYWKHVRLHEFDDWDDFLARRAPRPESLFLLEEFGAESAYDADYPADVHLVFGRETTGLPPEVLAGRRTLRLPMRSPHIRSLNLANAATAAAYLALRGRLD